jgi:hypothetical protein
MKYLSIILLLIFVKTTFSQTVAIEATKMNVLYKLVPNPLKIVVENHSCQEIIAKAKYGTITPTPDGCSFNYYTKNCTENSEEIAIGINEKSKIIWVDTLKFRLKEVLTNIDIFIGNNPNCSISKPSFFEGQKITAPFINFDIELNFRVSKYSIEILRNKESVYRESNIPCVELSSAFLLQAKKLHIGDTIRIFDLWIIYGDCEKKLHEKIFKIIE